MSSSIQHKLNTPTLDRAGITLSLICGLHCLLLPVILVALPMSQEWIAHDQTHFWVFILAVPIALISLLRSYYKYKVTLPLALGLIGIGILTIGLTASGKMHHFDFVISLTGSGFLVLAHILNIRSCRQAH